MINPNDLDNSDLKEILEREEKDKKLEIFCNNPPYLNNKFSCFSLHLR